MADRGTGPGLFDMGGHMITSGSEEDWKVGQKCDVVDCDGFVTKDSDYCFQHGENEVKEAELIPELKNMRSALELPRVTPA